MCLLVVTENVKHRKPLAEISEPQDAYCTVHYTWASTDCSGPLSNNNAQIAFDDRCRRLTGHQLWGQGKCVVNSDGTADFWLNQKCSNPDCDDGKEDILCPTGGQTLVPTSCESDGLTSSAFQCVKCSEIVCASRFYDRTMVGKQCGACSLYVYTTFALLIFLLF